MRILEFLSGPLPCQVGWALLHFLWEGTIVAFVTALAATAFEEARHRYAAYLVGFVVMAACPIVTFVAVDIASNPASISQPLTEARAPSSWLASPPAGGAPLSDTIGWRLPLLGRIRRQAEKSLPWVVAVWLVGVACRSTWLTLGFATLSKRTRERRPVPKDLLHLAVQVGEKLGLYGFRELCVARGISEPMVVGRLRQIVLIPVSVLTKATPELLEAIIAHELAHIRRLDPWANLLQRVVETVFFYHPAIWWLSGCIHRERERCCDDLSVRVTHDRFTYARALKLAYDVKMIEGRRAFALRMGPTKGSMLQRVYRVLNRPVLQQGMPFWLAGAIPFSLILALTMLTMATFSPVGAEAETAATHLLDTPANAGQPKEVPDDAVGSTPLFAAEAYLISAVHAAPWWHERPSGPLSATGVQSGIVGIGGPTGARKRGSERIQGPESDRRDINNESGISDLQSSATNHEQAAVQEGNMHHDSGQSDYTILPQGSQTLRASVALGERNSPTSCSTSTAANFLCGERELNTSQNHGVPAVPLLSLPSAARWQSIVRDTLQTIRSGVAQQFCPPGHDPTAQNRTIDHTNNPIPGYPKSPDQSPAGIPFTATSISENQGITGAGAFVYEAPVSNGVIMTSAPGKAIPDGFMSRQTPGFLASSTCSGLPSRVTAPYQQSVLSTPGGTCAIELPYSQAAIANQTPVLCPGGPAVLINGSVPSIQSQTSTTIMTSVHVNVGGAP